MTDANAERLATTKNSVQHARKFIGDDGGISFQYAEAFLDDFDWVIKQAERVPELEKKVEYYGDEHCRIQQLLAETAFENKRMKKALLVAFSHAVEAQSDGTIDVITDTLQGLDFTDIWDEDYEEGKKLWAEWMK